MNGCDYCITSARLILPTEVVEDASLVVRGGLIEAVLGAGSPLPADLERIDVQGAYVSPGLIEAHFHGAGGLGFEDVRPGDPEGALRLILELRAFLRSRGITSFVPTLTCRDGVIAALAQALEASGLPEADLPGLYIEGPFVDPDHRGGIGPETIQAYDPGRLDQILGLAKGRIRLMTYAPELPGAGDLCLALEAAGVLPCLGHSGAILPLKNLPQGRWAITHLFNAMSPISHREAGAGLALLPFLDTRPYVELNADGVHVNAEVLALARASLAPDRLILISDAASPAGLPPGDYSLGGRALVSGPRGVRYADSNVLMGSSSLLPQVLGHWLKVGGAPIHEAIASCSLVPARLLGIDAQRGAILPGLEAALVVWNGDFESVRLCLHP